MKKPRCRQCGACCYWVSPVTKQLIHCQWLVKLRGKHGKSLCNRWRKRNALIKIKSYLVIERDDKGNPVTLCIERKHSMYDFPDCPFNTGDKPYPPWVNKVMKKKKKNAKH